MQKKHLAAHLPSTGQSGKQSALALFDEVTQVVDDSLPLPMARLRAEEVERCFDLESLLISQRNGVPHFTPHHTNSGQHRADFHLQMKEVSDRAAVAGADMYGALVAEYRHQQ